MRKYTVRYKLFNRKVRKENNISDINFATFAVPFVFFAVKT
jgi:hypothetical protein